MTSYNIQLKHVVFFSVFSAIQTVAKPGRGDPAAPGNPAMGRYSGDSETF
jgi:hypothetical protein